jgi:hypothetical protein
LQAPEVAAYDSAHVAGHCVFHCLGIVLGVSFVVSGRAASLQGLKVELEVKTRVPNVQKGG